MIAQDHYKAFKGKPSSRTSMLACVVVVPLYLCWIDTVGYDTHRAILLCQMKENLSNWEIWCYWNHSWIGMVSSTGGELWNKPPFSIKDVITRLHVHLPRIQDGILDLEDDWDSYVIAFKSCHPSLPF
ncbi:hypothetical protein K492DRAFT_174643 [Lichtheimia hyalospora FSU 10163]|nr:hypothetical protein K492DRAFT_174643 [Lichtheimia hyalospora FSU 10163]